MSERGKFPPGMAEDPLREVRGHPLRLFPTADVCDQRFGMFSRILPTAGICDQILVFSRILITAGVCLQHADALPGLKLTKNLCDQSLGNLLTFSHCRCMRLECILNF